MPVTIDEAGLAVRVREQARRENDGVDVWIRWDGLEEVDRHEAAARVQEAADLVLDPETCWVCPTAGGTFVWVRGAIDWRRNVEGLAAELERRGHRARLMVPRTGLRWVEQSRVPAPAALIQLRLAPLDPRSPRRPDGTPMADWGVDPSASIPFLGEAARWVAATGSGLEVGRLLPLPATPADAPDILLDLVSQRVVRPELVARDSEGRIRRALVLHNWGTTHWCDTLQGRDPVEVVVALRQLLVRHALPHRYAAVGLAVPGRLSTDELDTGAWHRSPVLQETYVPRVHPVQLLNRRQLERAHDLSGWEVEAVGEDRWLVSAKDLRPWVELDDPVPLWTGDFPASEVREKAAADFGEMVLTREVAQAYREPRPD